MDSSLQHAWCMSLRLRLGIKKDVLRTSIHSRDAHLLGVNCMSDLSVPRTAFSLRVGGESSLVRDQVSLVTVVFGPDQAISFQWTRIRRLISVFVLYMECCDVRGRENCCPLSRLERKFRRCFNLKRMTVLISFSLATMTDIYRICSPANLMPLRPAFIPHVQTYASIPYLHIQDLRLQTYLAEHNLGHARTKMS
jgi:hypothetical protein